MELGTRVFYRAANKGAVSIALITGWAGETKANLAVKPDQSNWFDAAAVDQFGTEEDGAPCWSAWSNELQPTS